jgi:hypothetical protein
MASLLVSRVFGVSIPASAGNTSEAVLVERGKVGDYGEALQDSQYLQAAHKNDNSDVPV